MVATLLDALQFLAVWTVASVPFALATGRWMRVCGEIDERSWAGRDNVVAVDLTVRGRSVRAAA